MSLSANDPTPTTPPARPETVAADPLLTIEESAAYLSVSRSTIQKLIYTTRTLPAVRIPGPGRSIVRVRRSALDALLVPVTP